jgi:hypothetical protein
VLGPGEIAARAQNARTSFTGGAYVPTVVVGMYAPFGVVGVFHAAICMPWAFTLVLWHVEDPTMGAYITTTGVATYPLPAAIGALRLFSIGKARLSGNVSPEKTSFSPAGGLV